MTIIIREATEQDVSGILVLRYNAVENKLRKPLTYKMISQNLQKACKAWIAEDDRIIVAFSLANKKLKSLWGLFVLPSYQRQGLGGRLLQEAIIWLTNEARDYRVLKARKIWLDTEVGGRAESFYQHKGWQRGELRPNNEVRYWYYLQHQ